MGRSLGLERVQNVAGGHKLVDVSKLARNIMAIDGLNWSTLDPERLRAEAPVLTATDSAYFMFVERGGGRGWGGSWDQNP